LQKRHLWRQVLKRSDGFSQKDATFITSGHNRGEIKMASEEFAKIGVLLTAAANNQNTCSFQQVFSFYLRISVIVTDCFGLS